MSQFQFGSGVLWGTPLSDYQGTAIAVPTPVVLGNMQDVSISIKYDVKKAYGSVQFPIDVARGKGSITGKAKFLSVSAQMMGTLLFGQPITRTGVADVYDTVGIAIPATPFNITISSGAATATNVQVPGSGAAVTSLGVRDSSGNQMIAVASSPTTGQYEVVSIIGGTITLLFAAADTGQKVFLDYQYTYTGSGSVADLPANSIVTNALMGYAPTFQADFFNAHGGKQLTLRLFNAVSTSFDLATKLDDYADPSLDFEGFSNSSSQVLQWGTSA